jgi:2-dehydro-3-deoxy-D-gluconate 5-dehydrogenase
MSSATTNRELFDLSGQVAIVTGTSRGLGQYLARALAKSGADLVLTGRRRDSLLDFESEIKALGRRTVALELDVRNQQSIEEMVAKAVEAFGRIDILVNNAGIAIRKQPETYTLAEWTRVIDTNLTGAFLCAQAAYPHMQRSGGKIVNIGSMLSIFGASYATPYAASKGAIVAMTKALACAWAKDNIQVNAILPGWIDTPLTQTARNEVHGLHERILARTPAGRWGEPQDLAGTAVFLASPASDFVTGAAIPVDGGYCAQG